MRCTCTSCQLSISFEKTRQFMSLSKHFSRDASQPPIFFELLKNNAECQDGGKIANNDNTGKCTCRFCAPRNYRLEPKLEVVA